MFSLTPDASSDLFLCLKPVLEPVLHHITCVHVVLGDLVIEDINPKD